MKTRMYVHTNKDTNYWQAEKLGLSEKATDNFKYACLEVELGVDINEENGEVTIIECNGVALKSPTRG